MVATASVAARDFALSGRRHLRGGRAACEWLSAANFRPGGGGGHGSCRRAISNQWALGVDREVKLHRMPVSRARLSQSARTGHELLRGIFQSSAGALVAYILQARKFGAL